MAGSEKDKFRERLERIERERQTASGEAAPQESGPPERDRPKLRGAGVRLAAVAGMLVLVTGVIGGGGYALTSSGMLTEIPIRQMVRNVLMNVVAQTPTTDDYDGLLASGPKERKLRDTGWELPVAYVAAPGRSDLLLSQIAVMPDAVPDPTTPIEVASFDLNEECTLRQPRAGDVVRNVRLNDTARYTRVHMFSKEELAEAVIDRIEGITRHAKHYKNAAIADGRMGQVDVFVTDTTAPVHLVLQSYNRDILWNIHLADGVQLSHVAMIGNKSAFAAPDGDYTFEALRITDFLDEETFYRNAEIRPCMVAPWRSPEADWPLLQKLEHPVDASTYQGFLRNITQGHAAFNSWYTGQLGVDADVNLTTALVAANALSGPMPGAPIVQQPVTARTVHMGQNDYVAVGQDQLEALHRSLLMAATGNDLSILKPAAMEVVGQ